MHYIIYLDNLFLVNLMMNLYVLTLTGKLLKQSATCIRMLFAAAIGATAYCLFLAVPFLHKPIPFGMGTILTGIFMTGFSFRIRGLRRLMHVMGTFYVCAFGLGGLLTFLMRVLLKGEKHFPGTLLLGCGYLGSIFLSKLVRVYLNPVKSNTCKVIIQDDLHKIEVKALIDTGNSLCDPVSGKPVSILETKVWNQLPGLQKQEKYRVIPYHSVGKKQGILEGYEVEAIWIEKEHQLVKRDKVVIALSEVPLSQGKRFQMLLHPEILD